MEWESVLGELVAFIKNVAPDVWAIYMKQVVLNGIAYLAGGIALLVGTIWAFVAARKAKLEYEDDFLSGMIMLLSCMILFCAGACLFAALNHLVNPEYFIIRSLLGIVQ